jgi:predicted NBD/HSP70 family sugar kinase
VEIGIDIGGTKIAAGLVQERRVLAHLVKPLPRTKKETIALLRAMIVELRATAAKRRGIAKRKIPVGIGVPGLYRGTKIIYIYHAPWLNGTNMATALGEHVTLENDSRCFTIAEALYGAGRGAKTVAGITIGTGIGGGIVIDGALHYGAGGAGEFGHAFLDMNSPPTHIEHVLGGKGMAALYRANGGPDIPATQVWTAKSKAAEHTRVAALRALCILVRNVGTALDPHVIVVGGGAAHPAMLAHLRTIRAKAKDPMWGKWRVVMHKLPQPWIIGAALAARGKR